MKKYVIVSRRGEFDKLYPPPTCREQPWGLLYPDRILHTVPADLSFIVGPAMSLQPDIGREIGVKFLTK